ncbi:MAG TPA: hypothetical protein VI997_07920, partial [Candidatus Thermoplasmatota archaeon]|nr:hypothetical protein [Candidatus Thermoplasmatota archaeon]
MRGIPLRVLALLVVSLFVLEFPLAAMPAGASHARQGSGSVTDADVLAADDAACVATAPGSCKVQIVMGGTDIIGFRRDTDTADLHDWKPVNTHVIRAGRAMQVKSVFGTGDQGPNAGACRPDVTGSETTRRDIEWADSTLVTGGRSGTNTNADVTTTAGTNVVASTLAEDNFPTGYRTRSITVWNKVLCVAADALGNPTTADLDKSWNITLKDVPIDNTLPDYTLLLEPVGGSGIAKIGDPVHFRMVMNDGDFKNFESICAQYVMTMELDSLSDPDPGFFDKTTKRLDVTEFFTPGTDPQCFGTLDVTGNDQGQNLVVVTPTGGGAPQAWDYDNVPWSVGKARRGNAAKGATTVAPASTFVNFDVTVTDEALNAKVLSLSGASLPRIDALAPDPIDADPVDADLDPVVPTLVNDAARLTWPGTTLSYDVLGVKVDWRTVGTGPWTVLADPATDSQVRRAALATSYSYDAKPPITAATNVEFRLTTVDDAGNAGTPVTTAAIVLNPIDEPFAQVLRGDGLGLVPTAPGAPSFHPFDKLLIEAAGGSGIPTAACPGASCPVDFVMWRTTGTDGSGAINGYWNDQLGTFQATEVQNDVTRISTTPARFTFNFNVCVPRESSCLEKRVYYLQAVVKDTAGRVGRSTAIPLIADTKSPDFPETTNKNKVNLPAGKSEIMQGAFVNVSLKATDAISGLREVRFAFVPSQTSHPIDAIKSVFDRRSVACLAYPETGSPYTSNSRPVAYARIPAEDSPTCPVVFPRDQAPLPELLQKTEYFRCPTATNPCTHFETGLKNFDRNDQARMSQCSTLGAAASYEICYNATTPYVFVSTEGVPFGTWYLNVELVDWAGRKKDLTLGDSFTVVPRIALPGEVKDLTDSSITRVNKRYDNGKINLTVFAAYTDDVDAVGGACGAVTTSPTTIPSRTATCTPTSVTIDYLPAAQTDQEANYRVIKSFSVPSRLTPEVPAYSTDVDFEKFEIVRGEGGARFFRYDLKEFTLPSGSPPPTQTSAGNAVVRVVVKAKTTVGSNITEKTIKQSVELAGKPVPTAIQFLTPYTTWATDRLPTFYRAEGTRDEDRGSGKSDIDLKVAFQKANLPTANTAVYFRVYDRNLTYVHQVAGTRTSYTEPDSLWGVQNVLCPLNDLACVKGAAYYYRVTSVWSKANALDWESPKSDLATVLVNRTYLVKDGNPALAGDQPVTVSQDWYVPPGAPDLVNLGVFNAGNGKATISWTAPNSSTLSSPLASSGSIQVVDLSKFSDSGTVQIENERVRYSGRSGVSGSGTLTATTRGADGTSATGHASGAKVQLLPQGLPAGYALSAFRVYRGHVFDLTSSAMTLARSAHEYVCDTARPSNLSNPCRLVYWANGTADKSGKPEFSAAVNIHKAAGIEAVNNPDDPDHLMAYPRHNVTQFPTSTARHAQGALPWKAYEVNLTRGQYVLEISAHSPKPSTTPNTKSVFTSQRGIAQLTELGHVSRAFQVETRMPAIRVDEGAGDFRPFGTAITHWTDSTLSVNVCVDPKNFVKTDRKNVTAGLILGESSTGSGLTWVPGVTYSARKIDANSTKEFPTPLSGAASATLLVSGSALLGADLSATGTTIQVANLAAFDTSGAVRIDDERIWYSARSGVSGPGTLTVSKRGADGTSIEEHDQGAVVTALLGPSTTTIP